MSRLLGRWSLVVVLFAGCQSAEKAAVSPLPPNTPPLTFTESVQRATLQVGAAHEFFYRDAWDDVTQASTALIDTATRLADLKPEDVPAKHRDQYAKYAKALTEAAAELRTASQAKDAVKTTQVFQKLHLTVRDMRHE
jgi:hypothetical protein